MISYHTMSLLHIHSDDQSSWFSQPQYYDIRMPRYCHNVSGILLCYVTSKPSPWWPEFMPFMVPSKVFNSFYLKYVKMKNKRNKKILFHCIDQIRVSSGEILYSAQCNVSRFKQNKLFVYSHNVSDILACYVTSKVSP